MSKQSDYEKGYEDAFKYIRSQFAEEGPELLGFLDSIYKKPSAPNEKAKPVVYFTTLDKKGNLIADPEKTKFYAEHPKELQDYFDAQSKEWREFLDWKNAKKSAKANPPTKTLVKVTDSRRFHELFEHFTAGKTREMIEEENKLIYENMPDKYFLETQTPGYWNALGTQMSDLGANPRNLMAMFSVCGIDPNDVDAWDKVIKQASEEGFLFDIV